MAQTQRRYTTVRDGSDWIVTASWDEGHLLGAHWLEVGVEVRREATGQALRLPRELATFRVGETEHPFREYVRLDWGGDVDAAMRHQLDSLFRRLYAFIERGH